MVTYTPLTKISDVAVLAYELVSSYYSLSPLIVIAAYRCSRRLWYSISIQR
jgi:hypothetical protein